MKKTFLLLAALCCVIFLYAQNNEKQLSNEDFFTQAELVIEGQLVRKLHTYNLKGTFEYEDGYTITAIKVIRVYKGDPSLKDSIILVTQKGGLLDQEKSFDETITVCSFRPKIFTDHGIHQGVNMFTPSIYFLVPSDFPDDENSKFASQDKYKYVKRNTEDSKGYDKMYVSGDKILGLDNLVFHHRESFYNYMMQFDSFAVPEMEAQIENQPENEVLIDSSDHELFKEKGKGRKKKAPPKSSSDYTLTLEIANQKRISEGGKHYVMFDIMISENKEGHYFHRALMFIKYNTAIFGPSINNNAKITITKGSLFEGSGIAYTVEKNDINLNPDKIRVACQYSGVAAGNRTLLPIGKSVPLLHIKIELLSPTSDWEQANFHFELYSGIISAAGNCFYAETPCMAATKNYDSVFYNPTGLLPAITNFTPISRIAGVGEILTIQGTNFGNQRGTVYFTAANNGGQTYLEDLDNQYIDSWSNTQIKVKVPSCVYKGYSGNDWDGAGSGKIKIKTAYGNFCESASNLQIPYSVLNGRTAPTATIRRVYLSRYECKSDFEFTLHSEFNNSMHTDKVRLIDTALRHWSALTGLVLRLEKDAGNYVYTNSTNANGKNIIQFDDVNYAYVNNAVGGLLYGGDTLLYRRTGNPIEFGSNIYFPRSGVSWNYDVTGYVSPSQVSFYQTMMHELGHILQLGHVNDTTNLMYYEQLGGRNIIKLTSSNSVVLAVKQNISASKSPSLNWRSGVTGRYPPGALNAAFTTTKSCYGANNGSITTKVTGGVPGYFYKWTGSGITTQTTPNLSNLAGGTYNLELTDSQFPACTLNYPVNIAIVGGGNPLTVIFLKIPATQSTPELWSASITGGNTPYTYQWSAGLIAEEKPILDPIWKGIPQDIVCTLPLGYANTPNMPTSVQTSSCKLRLVVTDVNGCQIVGTPPASKAPAIITHTDDEITIYPNPTTGIFTVSNITDATIYLYSAHGNHIKTFEHVLNNEAINISNLPAGIYFIKIIEKNTVANRKLILSNRCLF